MKTISKLEGDTEIIKERWITDATTMLGVGKDQLSIITYIRTQGIKADEAKTLSYGIFDEAKKRLMKSQRVHRILGWTLITLGILALLIISLSIIMGSPFSGRVVVSGAPIMAGMMILSKIKNPARLPES